MNLAQQFDRLGRRQLAIQEGVALLQQARGELRTNVAAANVAGMVAVLSNVALIPLNCIVNAFELKKAQTAYHAAVRFLYDKFAKSGTRADGHAKTVLEALKSAIAAELRAKGMAELVPGVNILVGLAEDSIAAFQTVTMVSGGQNEMSRLQAELDRRISLATRELLAIGVRRAELLDRLSQRARTV
jgi:hypothetical protein